MIIDMLRYMLVGLSALVAIVGVGMLIVKFLFISCTVIMCGMICILGGAICNGYEQWKSLEEYK
jgi:uncharacterized membrane protein